MIIPAMSAIFSADVLTFGNDAITATVGSMSAEQIFTTYARHIGIGGIATAGVIGIINSWESSRSRRLGGERVERKRRRCGE